MIFLVVPSKIGVAVSGISTGNSSFEVACSSCSFVMVADSSDGLFGSSVSLGSSVIFSVMFVSVEEFVLVTV